ncbi:cyanophycin synthetase family protein, partial [Massilia sp. CT11-108]|uniref:cyanophycin synthetase family protein n=1 Tax=Massilia sp. CT11-108 TaxID=3393900 RepID=UPI0039A6D288
LLALLPAMPAEAAARLSDCQAAHEALEPVVMELQRLAGASGTFGMTKTDPARPGQARVVCGYTVEQVAGQALRTAAALIDACASHVAFDLDAALDDLRDTAHRHAIGT